MELEGGEVILSDYPVVVVTGGSGWLGRRVVRALTEGMHELGELGKGGLKVRCLVRQHETTDELHSLGVETVAGSVSDPEAVDALMRGADGGLVLHMAGMIHPPLFTRAFEDVNVEGAANLLIAARRHRAHRLIAMSSNSPFGGNLGPEHVFTEDSPYNPYMGYGRSKWRMEQLLRSAMDESNTPGIVIFRAPWFYGPGQPPRQTLFFKMVREGKFPILGDGLNRRSMGYVDSLALGMLLGAVKPEAAGQIYWIADERPYSMSEIMDTVKAVLRDDFGMTVSPRNLRLPSIVGDVARLCDATLQAVGLYHQKIHVLSEMNMTIACSIEKSKRELDFQPLVELREGMRRSVQWCLDSGISV